QSRSGSRRAATGSGGLIASSLPGAAVDHQILWPLGDFRIEIVHEHAQRGFLLPAFATKFGAARRPNFSRRRNVEDRHIGVRSPLVSSYALSGALPLPLLACHR